MIRILQIWSVYFHNLILMISHDLALTIEVVHDYAMIMLAKYDQWLPGFFWVTLGMPQNWKTDDGHHRREKPVSWLHAIPLHEGNTPYFEGFTYKGSHILHFSNISATMHIRAVTWPMKYLVIIDVMVVLILRKLRPFLTDPAKMRWGKYA